MSHNTKLKAKEGRRLWPSLKTSRGYSISFVPSLKSTWDYLGLTNDIQVSFTIITVSPLWLRVYNQVWVQAIYL